MVLKLYETKYIKNNTFKYKNIEHIFTIVKASLPRTKELALRSATRFKLSQKMK